MRYRVHRWAAFLLMLGVIMVVVPEVTSENPALTPEPRTYWSMAYMQTMDRVSPVTCAHPTRRSKEPADKRTPVRTLIDLTCVLRC